MKPASPPRLLLADDEPLYLQATSQLLRKAGFDCICVADAEAAIRYLRSEPFDLVLTDLNMPGNLKLELLQAGRKEWPQTPLIVVTGVPSLPTAIEGVRLGIADYLIKPVRFEILLKSIRRVLARPRETETQADPSSGTASDSRIIGSSEPMRALKEMIGRVAQTDANVLISGESGTGKELVAQAIHAASRRREKRFQIVDCTAIPESLFESLLFGHVKGSFTGAVDDQVGLLKQSDQGTAFFDEIGELPLTVQPKLLRVIQEQTFVPVGKSEPTQLNTRFISATNRNLHHEVEQGRFRRDLFYRLSVLHLELPPLRDRDDDVVELAEHFLHLFTEPDRPIEGFTPVCLERFRAYAWPGNIRELRNAIESAAAMCRGTWIDVEDLPDWIARPVSPTDRSAIYPQGSTELTPPQPSDSDPAATAALNLPVGSREDALGTTDKTYFQTLMRRYQGNISQAAKHAGVSRQTLHKLLNRHNISAAEYRRPSAEDR
ncbi:MAG: sigma-54-dependent Fis family transcriptional regulator [Planctomycetaceae bacterium]|nr:MAG: sigma-54-dependent Fis family transcriptional regulator [Planctomycetaceae bacterium]